MAISQGESIALWTLGILMFVVFMGCLGWRLFSITFKTMIVRMTGRGRKRRLNPTEKRVNKILSNESAREILKAHALTAINSQVRRIIAINDQHYQHDLFPGKQKASWLLVAAEPGQHGHSA